TAVVLENARPDSAPAQGELAIAVGVDAVDAAADGASAHGCLTVTVGRDTAVNSSSGHGKLAVVEHDDSSGGHTLNDAAAEGEPVFLGEENTVDGNGRFIKDHASGHGDAAVIVREDCKEGEAFDEAAAEVELAVVVGIHGAIDGAPTHIDHAAI